MKRFCAQKGFTLVEMAIVVTIIGIMIGSVVAGQQIATNARVAAQVSQVTAMDSGISKFRTIFSALPGDMANPSVRLPNCTAFPCSAAGDADGRIGTAFTAPTQVPAAGSIEAGAFWAQLAAVNLVRGVGVNGAAAFGDGYPAARIGLGGYQVGTANNSRLYLINVQTLGQITAGADSGVMTPSQAAQIDRKMDDGLGNTGSVLSAGAACTDAVGVYLEASVTKDCGQFYAIQE